ncbi:hypothetical protein QYE76_009713 [Lolium multiflorum]|uniref:Peptidase A2 domain-containing protein n=1 Tax=Lolium multiflorum TaxID=4521 RepID=A0AAD8X1H2_LOLMU|nr:hypothetical protein QYE76_009713 [Lolium multiflorum]
MSRLPTIDNCPECRQQRKGTNEVSVFKRLGPLPPQNRRAESSRDEDFEESDEEEDRYHRPRWCPDGLSHSQKRRVQRLRNLEEAEAQYLYTLRKARPDLAVKIQQTLETEARPPKKVWRPKQTKADAEASADTNMVFILPSEFCAPKDEEVLVAQFDCGPRPVIFEKPRERSYRHLKALYLRGYINGQPISKMLVDTGAAVNIMPYSMLRRLGRSNEDLIKTNVTLSDFNGQASEAKGVLNVDLTVGRKTIPTSFFIVDSKSTYAVLLGRDWIHANCCIPSTMHQCIIQWDGDEVEVVHADDSIEISLAGMNIWDADDQEPLSGISLDGCERMKLQKRGDGKLGYGFTSADELEEIDIGPRDKPRPTFISKKLDPHLRGQMIALLKEYPDCFAWDYTEMPGLDRSIIEHRLPLKKGFRPFQQRARQMKAEILVEVKKEIEKMLNAGFIRPCRYAEWISNVVPVEKKDGRWRVAIDFRNLNSATPKDEYPMPVAETLINAAAGHKVLSFMDGNAGYNQIFMAPEDIHKTAFRVPGSVGLFEYVVMTFGLKNAGATYQRAMNYIFHDLIGKLVEIYIDDVVVKSVSVDGHLEDLRHVLDRTRKFGLRMNPKKCAFGVTAGQFLGFLVHERGIEIGLKSQEAVRTMKPPTTKKELQCLIGKINFVRRFISNLSGRIEPFMGLVKIKSDEEFRWGAEQQRAFDEIKEYLTKPPVLVPPQQDRPFYIYLSVADTSIASVVVQVYDGLEKVVFYLSRRMLDAETSLEDVTELRLWSLEKIKENKAKVARAYNKKVRPKEFQVGDLVWEAVLPLGTKDKVYGKWSPNWHGPYKVDQVLKGNAYMLEQLDGVKFPVAVNGQHLKKYFPSMWDDGQ